MRLNQISIVNALKRYDFPFIKYRLEQLFYLFKTLKQPYIQQIYFDCLREIGKHMDELFERNKATFNRSLDGYNEFNQRDIELYLECMKFAEQAEILRPFFEQIPDESNERVCLVSRAGYV